MSAKNKIRFSIGAKLIIIISFIVIISLGSITALVSWLVQQDLRVSAEEGNFEINRRSAMEAESALSNARSDSRVLLQMAGEYSADDAVLTSNDAINRTADFFFTENPNLAAVFFVAPGGDEQLFVNSRFFASRETDEELAASFLVAQRDALGRAVRGETVLANGAPHFSRAVLALFYPWQSGVGGVLFSSEDLNNSYGFGTNKSYMLNSEGDVLSHADFSLVRDGTNVAGLQFIRAILDSEDRNRQQLVEADFGVLQSGADGGGVSRQFAAFTKLGEAGAVVITSIEFDKVFEGIAATTRRNIYLTVAVLSVSIIFIWFFSKTISIPLKGLAKAAQKIESGVFELELRSKSSDEIGVLTSSFQKMCSALHIFGRFTNREIAVKAMRNEIKPGGLPKHGTIFFSDIRGFTEKSENFTKHFAEDASNKIIFWLNNYFTEMIDCVEKTNGIIDKFIGDAVMAHWGTAYTAGSPQNDAYNGVKAAMMMREALYRLNSERTAGDPANPPIRIGCGINTGIVTAGQLGSDMRMEYTVIGDPVNLASRIEALNKPLGTDILISEDTWNFVGESFITEEMPSVTVKGKENPVRLFAVVNYAGNAEGPQSLAEVRELLGIEPPNLTKVDLNADEKKYKIGGETKEK